MGSGLFSYNCEFKQVPIHFKVFGIYKRWQPVMSHHTFNVVVGGCMCEKTFFWYWWEIYVGFLLRVDRIVDLSTFTGFSQIWNFHRLRFWWGISLLVPSIGLTRVVDLFCYVSLSHVSSFRWFRFNQRFSLSVTFFRFHSYLLSCRLVVLVVDLLLSILVDNHDNLFG